MERPSLRRAVLSCFLPLCCPRAPPPLDSWRVPVPARQPHQIRPSHLSNEVTYQAALEEFPTTRDISRILRAADAPENVLTILRDLSTRSHHLDDAAVCLLLQQVSLTQQRGAANERVRYYDESKVFDTIQGGDGVSSVERRKLAYGAREVFERSRRMGYQLREKSYTQLLVCLANAKAVRLAEGYYGEMKKVGLHVGMLAHTALVACLADDLPKLEGLVGRLRGAVEVDNSFVYNTLLVAAAREGHSMSTRWALRAMDRGEMTPTPATVAALFKTELLKGGNEGGISNAMRQFIRIKDAGLVMNHIVYHALLDACASAKAVEDAEGVIMMMREDKLEPTDTTFCLLAAVYGSVGSPLGIGAVLQRLHRAGVSPTIETLSTMMHLLDSATAGLLETAEVDDDTRGAVFDIAMGVLEAWEKSRSDEDSPRDLRRKTLESFAFLCCKLGRRREAETTIWKMREENLDVPSHLLQSAMRLCGDTQPTPPEPKKQLEVHELPFISPISF